MSLVNGYVKLGEFKAAHGIDSVDTTDDAVIERVLGAASRWMDENSGYTFYPRVEALLHDYADPYELELTDYLLSVISITNGDGASLAASEYNLLPLNKPPYRTIKIKASSVYYWTVNSYSDTEAVITVNGFWGYHNRFAQEGWKLITTVVEASGLNASDTTYTVASTAALVAGDIIKIDNEINIIGSISSPDLTVIERGDNGSTAAAHSNGASIYAWRVMPSVYQATYDLAASLYHRLHGENQSAASIITAGGVVITPRDIPEATWGFVNSIRSRI